MAKGLSSDRLRAYIREIELPLRGASLPPETAEKIMRSGAFVASSIEHHDCLERAMTHARRIIAGMEDKGHSVASGTAIIADTLSRSKGRFSRSWHAPPGGLWGALVYVNTLLPHSRLLISPAAGVACCEALREFGADQAAIRWINDVLCQGMKVAGFLVESFSGSHSKEEYFLIGFGININNREFPEDLAGTATSLSRLVGHTIDLERFSYCFLAKLTWNLGLLHYHEARCLKEGEEPGMDHPLIDRWRDLCDSIGKHVIFGFDVMNDPQYRATVKAIENDGGLRLVLEDGREITEHSGEIRYLYQL